MSGLPTFDINMVLHQGRGALLREIPRGATLFLSAGCAGRWFFDWVQQCYGDIPRHIGLEYYVEKPSDLPDNVEWVENTCSDMSGVESASCDVVFSGQNIEHLWPGEVIGFLLEAARVTRPGGLLVMDSPNRGITEHLRDWSHPEHIVEFTLEEAKDLVEAAGFDVSAAKGIWLCRDPRTGTMLPRSYEPGHDWSVPERLVVATGHPADALLWWIEARRSDREPNAALIDRRVHEIFHQAWPERAGRMSVGAGQVELQSGEEWVRHPEGAPGPVVYGPYIPLLAGDFACTFHLDNPGRAPVSAVCDVMIHGATGALDRRTVLLPPGRTIVQLAFELTKLEFGLEFRCLSVGQGPFLCRRLVDLTPLSTHGRLDLEAPPKAREREAGR